MALHRTEEARYELQLAEREMAQLAPARFSDELASALILRGEIALHDQHWAEAEAVLRKALAGLRSMQSSDAWSVALFQLDFIAQISRESGDWNFAEFAARQLNEHDPSYAGGHYALGLVAEHSGDAASAGRQFRITEKLWGGADADLPQLVRLRKELAAGKN